MEIGKVTLERQQPLTRADQVDTMQNQQQVLMEEQKKRQAQTPQQVQKNPPPPDRQQGQTFSTYA